MATIVFAFKNNKLLQLLKRRGEAVMYADEEWQDELEDQILKLVEK